MPRQKRKVVRNGRLWQVWTDDRGSFSTVKVRVGARLVCQIPGPVLGMARLPDGKLLLTFRGVPPVLVDLHTGENEVVAPAQRSQYRIPGS